MTSLVVHRYGAPGAPTVVLVHGLTEAGTAWPELVACWRDRWDILAPDLRGHGASPRFEPHELGTATEVLLADLVGLLDSLTGPVVLVGHSLGGYLSLRAALERPEKVRALVLEDPAKPLGADHPEIDLAAMNEAFLDTVADDPVGEVARMLRETPWSAAEVEAWAASKPLVDREYIRHGLVLTEVPWEGSFHALAMPTLLVVPPDASMAPRADGVDNPLVRTAVVSGAGHCVRRDRHDEYVRLVDEFLAEVAAHAETAMPVEVAAPVDDPAPSPTAAV